MYSHEWFQIQRVTTWHPGWGMVPRPGEENCKRTMGGVVTRLSSSGVVQTSVNHVPKFIELGIYAPRRPQTRIVLPSFAAQRRVTTLAGS
jgi:hypothetical protein